MERVRVSYRLQLYIAPVARTALGSYTQYGKALIKLSAVFCLYALLQL